MSKLNHDKNSLVNFEMLTVKDDKFGLVKMCGGRFILNTLIMRSKGKWPLKVCQKKKSSILPL